MVWGSKGFDGELWLRELRAEGAICLVKHGSQRYINANVKEALAGVQWFEGHVPSFAQPALV